MPTASTVGPPIGSSGSQKSKEIAELKHILIFLRYPIECFVFIFQNIYVRSHVSKSAKHVRNRTVCQVWFPSFRGLQGAQQSLVSNMDKHHCGFNYGSYRWHVSKSDEHVRNRTVRQVWILSFRSKRMQRSQTRGHTNSDVTLLYNVSTIGAACPAIRRGIRRQCFVEKGLDSKLRRKSLVSKKDENHLVVSIMVNTGDTYPNLINMSKTEQFAKRGSWALFKSISISKSILSLYLYLYLYPYL